MGITGRLVSSRFITELAVTKLGLDAIVVFAGRAMRRFLPKGVACVVAPISVRHALRLSRVWQ